MIVYKDRNTGKWKIGKSGSAEYETSQDARRAYKEKRLEEIRKNLNKIGNI